MTVAVRIVLIVLIALAQTDGRTHAQGSGILVRHQAPTDRALDFQLATLQAEFADMKAQKRASTRLIEGGRYSMNARYLTGAEAAQVHKTITEFYFVRDGSEYNAIKANKKTVGTFNPYEEPYDERL